MNKRVAVIAVIFIGLLGAGMVRADYIQLNNIYVGKSITGGSSITVDLSSMPYPLGDSLYVYVDASGYGDDVSSTGTYCYYVDFQLSQDTIRIKSCYNDLGNDYSLQIIKNSNAVVTKYSPDEDPDMYKMLDSSIRMVNTSTVEVTAYCAGATVAVNITITPGNLKGLYFYAGTNAHYSINSVTIKRYSNLLTGLKVYDENSMSGVANFDFTEDNNTVRVYDLTGTYIARRYYVGGPTELEAYLLKYTDGHWYSIHGPALSKIEALKLIEDTYRVVAYTTTDPSGIASLFLGDGALYKFRITDANGTIYEVLRTTDPSSPNIYLTALSLGQISVTASKLADISYSVTPSTIYIGQNNTIEVTVVSPHGYLKEASAELKVNGKTVAEANLTGSPSGGTMLLNYTASGLTLMDRVWLTLTITSTDNLTMTVTKNILLDYPQQGESTGLKESLEKAPSTLGIGKVGSLLLATFVAIFIIIATGARGAASVAILLGVYAIFTYIGWVDWRITAVALLAGLGVVLRREE